MLILERFYKHKTLLVSSLSGNFLEFYNFIVFAFVNNEIITNFFPSIPPQYKDLVFFLVFFVGYASRLFGAFIMGPIADIYGRKTLLLTSIIMITISSVGIGVMPSYYQIGILAPTLLVILRAIQGLAVSGEETSAAVLLVETIGEQNKGLIGSMILSSAYLGMLFGSLTILIINHIYLPTEIFRFAWRLPFLVSAIIAIPILYIRMTTFKNDEKVTSSSRVIYNKLFSSSFLFYLASF